MKIYVAVKSSESRKLNGYMNQLQYLGHTITHRSTEYDTVGDRKPAGMDIINADLVIFVMTDPAYTCMRTSAELGLAIETKRKIIVVSPDPLDVAPYTGNIFLYYPGIKHATNWEGAMLHLQSE